MDMISESFKGELLSPADPGFDEHRRIWNGMIDRRPALIARCTDAADVVAVVGHARAEGLPLAVRGGGHGVAGKAVADGALLVDLSLMNRVDVDPARKTARVGGGTRLGDLDRAAQAFGLATTAGVDSRTGVAGLTLGGGQGYLARRFGLTIDNLLSAEVVTADGGVVRASEVSNTDLFWALRGGGGNFGIVTEFELQLHDVGPEVFVGLVFMPIEAAAETLRRYRDIARSATDELSCYALIVNVPSAEPFPAAHWATPAVALVACYSGPIDSGPTAMRELEALEGSSFRSFEAMPYATLQSSFDGGAPDGARYYWKSHYITELTDEAIEALVPHMSSLPGPYANVFFEPLGGAVAEVAEAATAFPHRQAMFSFGVQAGWTDAAEDQVNIAWARSVYGAMAPFATGGAYSNYIDFDDEGKAGEAFGGNLERLRTIKKVWDPDGVFEGNKRF